MVASAVFKERAGTVSLCFDAARRDAAMTRRHLLAGAGRLAFAASGLLILSACRQAPLHGPRVQPVPQGANVLALGDSLTQGVGASAKEAFPFLLAQRTGWNVINAGVSGNTSGQALARLPDLLAQHRPALVIVGIGGNDFLRRQSVQATEANIEAIVQACLDANAQVLLVAMPEVNMLASAGWLSDHAMYQNVAQRLQVPILAGAWSSVLADARLRSDQIHANAEGYAQFLGLLQARLHAVGLLAP